MTKMKVQMKVWMKMLGRTCNMPLQSKEDKINKWWESDWFLEWHRLVNENRQKQIDNGHWVCYVDEHKITRYKYVYN